jgi:hypothetical protein
MKTASYTILMNLVADGLVDELVIATDDSATWIYGTQWLDRTLAPEPEPEPAS